MTSALTTVLSDDDRLLCGNRNCGMTLGYAPRQAGEAAALVAGYRSSAPGIWERRPVQPGERRHLVKPKPGDAVRCWACGQLMQWAV